MPDITSVTVTFGHGIKREEYGPVKKAEVSITASVADGEMGETVLASVSAMALAKVAEMLDAPKPTVVATHSQEEPAASGEAPARRSRAKKAEPAASSVETPASVATEESAADARPTEPVEDEWAAGVEDILVTDAELLSANSKRAQELSARQPIIDLILTYSTRTEGPPFKVQEIPQNQRKDYLAKLAALTA